MDYNRNFNCKYCNFRGNREELVQHVEDNHSDMLSSSMPASRLVYNWINKVATGSCVVCKKSTGWNDKTWKYNRLCGDPACKEKLKETYRTNAVKAKGKYTFTNDPEHVAKMLANRKISGTYTFSDGGKKTYTGTYEKKALEFFDKVLGAKSEDVLTPGPVITYEYDGTKHFWLTDIFYVPFNLVIEVKDGGDNPNTRSMVSYREKQTEKEKAIASLKVYNYLRLTNNNFEQLLQVMTALRLQMINDDKDSREVFISINESAGDIMPKLQLIFINSEFDKDETVTIGLTDESSNGVLVPMADGIKEFSKDKILENSSYEIYDINRSIEDQITFLEYVQELKNSKTEIGDFALYSMITGKDFINRNQLIVDKSISFCTDSDMDAHPNILEEIAKCSAIANTQRHIMLPIFESEALKEFENRITDPKFELKLKEDIDGIFVCGLTENGTIVRTKSYKDRNDAFSTIPYLSRYLRLVGGSI